jgi:hypothetical protein
MSSGKPAAAETFFSTFVRMENQDTENVIVNPEEPEQTSEPEIDDAASTSSTASASRLVRKCTFCSKEMQTRSLFNHIYKTHPYHFLASMSVYKDKEMEAYVESGNSYPFEYSLINDFDETEEYKIFGCLGCKHTFTVEEKANCHCQQKKCKAAHVKGLKKMIKDEKESRKKPNKQLKRKTVPEMKKIVELEMRRYKHLSVVSKDLQDLYANLKEKNDTLTEFDDTKLFPITEFSSIDFRADTDAGVDGLEKQFRLWARRNMNMEDRYVELRDYLYNYSATAYIDRYKAMGYETPERIFVGCSSHEALGEAKYPPL